MEDIAADDDLLSDMLLDSLEFEPKITTHKMNQVYRSPRYKTQAIIDIVRHKIVVDGDLQGAVDALCAMDVIRKHLQPKSQRQRYEFQVHARRYLETYMADGGIEFALTTRYQRCARAAAFRGESSQQAVEREAAEAAAAAAEIAADTSASSHKGKLRAENGDALGTTMADLCVVATKPFKAGDLIMMCKGGVKDLTKAEDDALREEASLGRERRKEQQYAGVLGAGRDFSVIRSARKGCSQLLLGPARFVNHDCDPNCEFHRVGQSQMVFRCLRNIGLNEEITTYYGDNYFEMDNAECMCKTCEVRARGIFDKRDPDEVVVGQTEVAKQEDGAHSETRTRRASTRKTRSPPPAVTLPTTIRIERNGKLIEKTFTHHVSRREFDEHQPHVGPQCTCLTCGSPFWAPEAWWLPDECRRCERHFKIFQGDWPTRVPTEPKWSAIYQKRRVQRDAVRSASSTKHLLDTGSPGTPASEGHTPIKMSPLRDTTEHEEVRPMRDGVKRRRIIPDEESRSSDGEVEEAIGFTISKKSSPRPANPLRQEDRQDDEEDIDDEDMSDLTSVSVLSHRSGSVESSMEDEGAADKPCGPKMLGKHAKTETLAMYWGAPSTNKRERKQRINGLESLSDTVKMSSSKHRRTASDVSMKSGRDVPFRSFSASQQRKSAISQGSLSPAPLPDSPSATASPTSSAAAAPPVLATHGPERTSVKNLAMAWGAPSSDAGRGSRRRTPREVGTPTTLTTPPSSSAGAAANATYKREDSLTPPFAEERLQHFSAASSVFGNGIAKSETFRNGTSLSGSEVTVSTEGSAILPGQEDGVVTTSLSHQQPALSSTTKARWDERSASPSSMSPGARTTSPLAGPLPPTLATARPGTVPGRKNLRWGKGKVSVSRPIGFAASPLANGAFPQQQPSDRTESEDEQSSSKAPMPVVAVKEEATLLAPSQTTAVLAAPHVASNGSLPLAPSSSTITSSDPAAHAVMPLASSSPSANHHYLHEHQQSQQPPEQAHPAPQHQPQPQHIKQE